MGWFLRAGGEGRAARLLRDFLGGPWVVPFIEVGKELDTVWGLLGLQPVWFKLLVGSQGTGAECWEVWPEGEDWEVLA